MADKLASSADPTRPTPTTAAWAVPVWALAAAAMAALDGRVDLANLGMVLVLASTLSALCLPLGAALVSSVAALAAFNWFFVPPRGSFSVDLHSHAVLLGAMLAVNGLVTVLVARLRAQAAQARHHAAQAEQLRAWADRLRDLSDPAAMADALHQQLIRLVDAEVASLVLNADLPAANDPDAAVWLGQADTDAREGLWLSLRQSRAMGPGTGWHDAQPAWFLPWRDGQSSHGASRLALHTGEGADPALRTHAQALCDQLGAALGRAKAQRGALQAREQAQAQAVRNALLAAISHDHRTPLATILGAATSLIDQADRLSPEQRLRLATTVRDQATQLSRLTDNTLQLARLDAPGVTLRLDWESPEEIVGAALNRVRQRDPQRRLRARLEPGLPLLRCDAVLLAQLLDNLIDNALAYSPAEAPVELLARRQGAQVVLAVRDRGPGIAPAWRDKVFDVFQRGETAMAATGSSRAGAGVGLAVCRAIARAHGGELRLRARAHGGCAFECWLPLTEAPAPAPAESG